MTGVHLGILVTGLMGFFALALATERHSHHLLRRTPAPRWRHLARAVGWGLLVVSLALAIARLNIGVGITIWLGWLSIAALVCVFGFPKWPWQPAARPGHARSQPGTEGADVLLPVRPAQAHRVFAALLLLAVPLVYGLALQTVPSRPLLRADAIDGQVGPWRFRLAEAEQRGPDLVAMDIPMKGYQVRFSEPGDLNIRAAYLRVNKPRSLRAPGIVFNGARWDRQVDIQLPANTTADSELWLTVVGKDGAVHQTAMRMGDVSPTTVAWFGQRN